MIVTRKRSLSPESVPTAVKKARSRTRKSESATSFPSRVTLPSNAYPSKRTTAFVTASSASLSHSSPSVSTPTMLPPVRTENGDESHASDISTRPGSLLCSRSQAPSPPLLDAVASSVATRESLPVEQEARLSKVYEDTFDRIWSGNMVVYNYTAGPYELITRLGLWTGTREEAVEIFESSPDLVDIIEKALKSGQFYEICSYPLFVNKINLAINKSLDGVDAIFQTIREGTLPSASFERFARDHPQLQVLLVDPAGQEYGADHSAKLADEAFMRKRNYITASSTAKTRLLLQGLSQYWGLYFSFSTRSSSRGKARSITPESQDLASALKHLAHLRKSEPDVQPISIGSHADPRIERLSWALYLSRILILYQFLDSLPSHLSETQAQKEWLYFQLNPPLTSDGIDVFSAVFRDVMAGEPADLQRAAECRLTALGWRNHKWFSKSLTADYVKQGAFVWTRKGTLPPFYLVIDEVAPPPSALDGRQLHPNARRANRKRAAVYSLLGRS